MQSAINAASAGATIRICPGTYQRSGVQSVAEIRKNLTLIGAGTSAPGVYLTVLDGGNVPSYDPVVEINGDITVALRGLEVTRGKSTGVLGGGIDINDATVTLTELLISNNVASSSNGYGGGMYNALGVLTLNRCEVKGNTAANRGGGIYSNGTLTLNATTVTENVAGSSGGGIYANSVTLNDSLVTNNQPDNCAGAGC